MFLRRGDSVEAERPKERSLSLQRGLVIAAGVVTAIFVVRALIHPGANTASTLFGKWFFNGALALATLAVLGRAWARREDRLAWTMFGLATLMFLAGNLIYYSAYYSDPAPPYPSAADACWLLVCPLAAVGFFLLARARVTRVGLGLWLDVAIAATAVGAIYAALVVSKLPFDGGVLSSLGLATTLAYPVGDFIIVAAGIALLAVTGWRFAGSVTLITLAFVTYAIADGAYLVQTDNATYVPGGLLDAMWMVAAALSGAAAVVGHRRAMARSARTRNIVIPAAFGLLALALLFREAISSSPSMPVVVLSALTMLLVVARMSLHHLRADQLVQSAQHEAGTDALTGLANRRSLLRDLDLASSSSVPSFLSMFDLDGFKYYNDTYGHPAGDELLRRIARTLDREAGPGVRAYRLGGDEFCLLGKTPGTGLDQSVSEIATSIAQRGQGFKVSASYGTVRLQAEAPEGVEALRVADRRMYAAKNHGRASAERQSTDVLMAVVRERSPDLGEHAFGVSELTVALGRAMGIEAGELQQLRHAAILHDIGKMAIPEEILAKGGSLDEEEWSFVRRHTLIGERIVGSAPALAGVANIIRSTHERWDGEGYPDGLAGEEIPLGARAIFVCDAFEAMTAGRPYAKACSPPEAIMELKACSGTQFDPDLVETFMAMMSKPAAEADAKAAPAIAVA
jgi:two-component system cell cycle response regulator